ncbi:two-component system response regulator CreB [Paucibacter sp. O1-1]|uniref:two-component system response regulator CreB n=2 Tax=unclassified Roseateles TaxID=2626991 RepID=UPI0021D514E9|nr:two-component system response regulator CreB [Paucibacter sp. M5-1]MCU7370381.1 two-component system response regulator CreB [Paucibacter sp. O1-1]MCZ7881867.1 two-component system response regulator CreB [Paucibacter sp. M5-1]MDA3825366.1 two-component system response regulator CreB [Paucibacter sp. O1-1]
MSEILLLEDDPAIAQTVVFALQREGFVLAHCSWLHEARARLAQHEPALAIFDVGLPDGNGLDLCRELRAAGSRLPLLMLSARSEELDRVLGLELGADDYLAKPFSPRELVARVRALLRRAQAPVAAPAPQGFVIEAGGSRIRFRGQLLDLTRRELGLLSRLLAAPQRIHSRETLLDAVWGHEADSGDRTVDTHIKTLRAKLRAVAPELDPIRTHRGLGYSLE